MGDIFEIIGLILAILQGRFDHFVVPKIVLRLKISIIWCLIKFSQSLNFSSPLGYCRALPNVSAASLVPFVFNFSKLYRNSHIYHSYFLILATLSCVSTSCYNFQYVPVIGCQIYFVNFHRKLFKSYNLHFSLVKKASKSKSLVLLF